MNKNLVTLALFLIAATAANIALADTSVPRAPQGGDARRPGVGRFEQLQQQVMDLMDHLGWDSSTEFEETGLKMRDLLMNLVLQDKESAARVVQLNEHFSSENFKGQPDAEKKGDIFEAKVEMKMRIREIVLKR